LGMSKKKTGYVSGASNFTKRVDIEQ